MAHWTSSAGCREVLYEEGPDGKPVVTGLRLRSASKDRMVHGDCYVAALDCQGAKKLIPSEWRKFPLFDNIHKLEGVPVITVQLRYAFPSMSDHCMVRVIQWSLQWTTSLMAFQRLPTLIPCQTGSTAISSLVVLHKEVYRNISGCKATA